MVINTKIESRKYSSLRTNLDRAKQERKYREDFKGDLIVMCVALVAIFTVIVVI